MAVTTEPETSNATTPSETPSPVNNLPEPANTHKVPTPISATPIPTQNNKAPYQTANAPSPSSKTPKPTISYETRKTPKATKPSKGGWGYIIVASGAIANLMLIGWLQTQSFFFVEWKKEFNTTSVQASWMVSMGFTFFGLISKNCVNVWFSDVFLLLCYGYGVAPPDYLISQIFNKEIT